MLDDLKSTDNVVRSAVILKVLGKMVGGVGVKSPGVKIEISQEAAKVTIAAAEIQNPRRAEKRSARASSNIEL